MKRKQRICKTCIRSIEANIKGDLCRVCIWTKDKPKPKGKPNA